MDIQIISAIIFILLMCIYLFKVRKDVELQKILFPLLYFVLYRTKLGIKFMKKTADKYPGLIKKTASVGVVVGFLGMAFISINIIMVFVDMIFKPDAPAGVAPVLPVPVEGAIYVPFFYWILCIFVIAIVHEFAHGIVSSVYKIPIKSSGFAFLGIVLPIVPAAFVEPDEKMLQKSKPWKQLSVYAAGPFANIILAFLVIGFMAIAINPIADNAFNEKGVLIQDIFNQSSAQASGLEKQELITQVNNETILNSEDFISVLSDKKVGDEIYLVTNKTQYNIELGTRDGSEDEAFLGVSVLPHVEQNPEFVDKYGQLSVDTLSWFSGLFMWMYILNLGIGLFNLLPLGPIDGGRMLQLLLKKFSRGKNGSEKANKMWGIISWIFFLIVVYMLIRSFM